MVKATPERVKSYFRDKHVRYDDYMRLRILYNRSVEGQFKEPLNGLNINFDSKWRFNYKNGKLITAHGASLLVGFFPQNTGKVDVPVVSGCNGVGKTSIATIIHQLSIGDNKLSALFVCEDKGLFSLVVARLPVEIEIRSQDDDTVESAVGNSLMHNTHTTDGYILQESAFKCVYYLPIYTAQHQMDMLSKVEMEDALRFSFDISTFGLMRTSDCFHVGRNHSNDEAWKQFEREEARYTWQFLCKCRVQARREEGDASVSAAAGRVSSWRSSRRRRSQSLWRTNLFDVWLTHGGVADVKWKYGPCQAK